MKFVKTCICIFICIAVQAFGQAPSATDLPPATVGQDYSGSVTFDAKGWISFQLDLVGKLPEGLTLNPDGTIQGKATKAGAVRVGVFLSDARGPVTSGIFSLQVNAPPAGAPAQALLAAPAAQAGAGTGSECPGKSIARPRLTSHLAEGVTKISGTAQATATGCTTKVRVWLVPNESEDIVSNNESVEMLSAHDGDAVVTAQGTWTMELDQALDSGQFIQVEQYFESDTKDAAGQSQTKVTTFLSDAEEKIAAADQQKMATADQQKMATADQQKMAT